MLAESYVHKLANACNHRSGVMLLTVRRLYDFTSDLELDDSIDRSRISKAYRSTIMRVASDFDYTPGSQVMHVENIEEIGITEMANLFCRAASASNLIPRKRVWENSELLARRLLTIFNVYIHLLIDKRAVTRKEVRSRADRLMRDWGKHMTDPRKIMMVAERLRNLSHREPDQRAGVQSLLESLHDFDGSPDDLEFEAIAMASLARPNEAS